MVNYLIFIIPIFLTIFIICSQIKKIKSLKKLSNYFTGTVSKSFFNPSFKGNYQGQEFSIFISGDSDVTPTYLEISLTKGYSPFSLFIHRLHYKGLFLKKSEAQIIQFGEAYPLHKIKINNAALDKEFLIYSNLLNKAVDYINNTDISNTIKELLLNKEFAKLYVAPRSISVKKFRYNLNSDLEPQNIMIILQKLNLLVKKVDSE